MQVNRFTLTIEVPPDKKKGGPESPTAKQVQSPVFVVLLHAARKKRGINVLAVVEKGETVGISILTLLDTPLFSDFVQRF